MLQASVSMSAWGVCMNTPVLHLESVMLPTCRGPHMYYCRTARWFHCH